MRFPVLPIAPIVAAMLLSIAPASAQTVNVTAAITSPPYGPITACPVAIKFTGTMSASGVASGLLQYKWSNSGALYSLNFPNGVSTVTATDEMVVGKTGMQSNGLAVLRFKKQADGSLALAETYGAPVNFYLTCPSKGTPGSLARLSNRL
jgi:hypothetical protein